jgi:HK97 family phage prohead protease
MTERLIHKTVNFEIKEIDETNASFWATASDEGVDRDGDIISQDGWDLKGFKKNPVVPLFHNYHEFPVAKAAKVKIQDGKLMFKPIFAVNENPQAKIAFDLYKGGFMNAFSVGFLPVEFEEETRKDGRIGRNYSKVELLEISAVLVPSNPNALAEARSKGIDVDGLEEKKWFNEKMEVEDKFAHNSTLADSEPTWGDVDKAKLPQVAFARKGESDKKSTWGYPHHWVSDGEVGDNGVYTSGTMYLHKGGLNAAWSAAQGGRTGQEAEAAVKSHLEAHRKALGLDGKEIFYVITRIDDTDKEIETLKKEFATELAKIYLKIQDVKADADSIHKELDSLKPQTSLKESVDKLKTVIRN